MCHKKFARYFQFTFVVYIAQPAMDNIIISRDLQIERKHFFIEFRENERGQFVRITEEAHGRRNSIIIPSTGLTEFAEKFEDVMVAVRDAQSA